jgi:hypothetical protein
VPHVVSWQDGRRISIEYLDSGTVPEIIREQVESALTHGDESNLCSGYGMGQNPTCGACRQYRGFAAASMIVFDEPERLKRTAGAAA